MFEKITEACQFLLDNFPESQNCKSYLNSRISESFQQKFQFGYFPNTENLTCLTSIVSEDMLKKNNLLYLKDIEDSMCPRNIKINYFENHPLIFPFKDTYGNIVGLVGRSLLSDHQRVDVAKYKNTSFTKGNYVFGLFENKQSILDNNLVYVVEGQFDVIKASEKGLANIVALGTSSMTDMQFSTIMRYTDNIILLLDNDDAGEAGRKKIMQKFGQYANIQNFWIPRQYKDIDECLSNIDFKDLSFEVKR